jgi:aldehyde:ferredoxin oxidoreductase
MCTPDQGAQRGQQVKAPEFQSAWALGVNCGILDYHAIIAAYAACNDVGVDALSMGGVVGFAMECWQHGLLDRDRVARDYDGLRLDWGNCGALLRAIAIVAGRQGWLGELLADGVRAAAERLPASASFAMHVKGMELPAYDPRACWSMALAYATSCRGACHLKSYALDAELTVGLAAGASAPSRAAMVVQAENRRAVADSALVCSFAGSALTQEWLVSLLRAVTGRDLGGPEIELCGARVCGLERVLALRQGISAADDRLPDRLFDEPIKGGECDGARLDRADFGRLLADYYALRGWSRDGVPSGEVAQPGEFRLASS